jgi:multidrug efflux pump subunit AcrB
VRTPADIGDTLVALRGGEPVLIKHVAEVRMGAALRRGTAAANGEPIPLAGLTRPARAQIIRLLSQLANDRQVPEKYCSAAVSNDSFVEILFNLYLGGVVLFL